MAVQFHPPDNVLSNHSLCWWNTHEFSYPRRGSAVFYEVHSYTGVSPMYWAETCQDGRYRVWGDAEVEGSCASEKEARITSEVFIESEYRRVLQVELAKLEALCQEIRSRVQVSVAMS